MTFGYKNYLATIGNPHGGRQWLDFDLGATSEKRLESLLRCRAAMDEQRVPAGVGVRDLFPREQIGVSPSKNND